MKLNITAIITSAAVLAFAPAAALAQENRISYPTEENAVLVVEQRGASELRAGSTYDYSLHVRNESDQPLHGVKVVQSLPTSFQIESENPRSTTEQAPQPQAYMKDNQSQSAKAQSDKTQKSSQQQRTEPQNRKQERTVWERVERKSESEDRQANNSQQMNQQRRQQAVSSGGKSVAKTNRQQPQTNSSGSQQQQMTNRVWTIGMLAPQEERVIRVSGVPTTEGQLKSCVYASYDKALCTTLRVTKPELSLVRAWINEEGNEEDQFFICEPINIRYTIRNEGTGTTAPAIITEELPEGITTREGDRQIEINAGELEAGQSETFMVAVKAEQQGQFSNRATARAGELSSQSNADSIRLNQAEIDVSVEGRSSEHIGRDVEYRITVQNLSNEVPAVNTQIRIPGIDERMRFATTDQNIPTDVDTFKIGTLSPGEAKSFSIVFSSDEAGEVSTQVEAMAYCAENATASISTNFEGVPALQVFVVDQQDPVEVNGETVYEISILNEGTAMDADVKLTGNLPSTLEFVSATGDTEVEASGGKLQFSPVKNLAPGDRASWLITVRGVQAGKEEFSLDVNSKSGSTTSGEPTTVY